MSDHTLDFPFVINAYGKNFNEVEIIFNCNLTIQRIYIGERIPTTTDPDKLPTSNVEYSPKNNGSKDITILFPNNTVGNDNGGPQAITIAAHADFLNDAPKFMSINLSLKGSGPPYPYTQAQIDYLNQKYIP